MKRHGLRGMTALRSFEALKHAKNCRALLNDGDSAVWHLERIIDMLDEAVRLGLQRSKRRARRVVERGGA